MTNTILNRFFWFAFFLFLFNFFQMETLEYMHELEILHRDVK